MLLRPACEHRQEHVQPCLGLRVQGTPGSLLHWVCDPSSWSKIIVHSQRTEQSNTHAITCPYLSNYRIIACVALVNSTHVSEGTVHAGHTALSDVSCTLVYNQTVTEAALGITWVSCVCCMYACCVSRLTYDSLHVYSVITLLGSCSHQPILNEGAVLGLTIVRMMLVC